MCHQGFQLNLDAHSSVPLVPLSVLCNLLFLLSSPSFLSFPYYFLSNFSPPPDDSISTIHTSQDQHLHRLLNKGNYIHQYRLAILNRNINCNTAKDNNNDSCSSIEGASSENRIKMLFTGSRYIVAGVTLLIAYIAITSQVFVFIPWLMSISVQSTFMVLVPFNIGVSFIYWHYYLACTTEPGSTPPGWGVSSIGLYSLSMVLFMWRGLI